MNSDEISSHVTKAVIMLLTWLAARYLPGDSAASYIPTVAAGIGALAAFGYGVYQHRGMKKVPETAVVIPAAATSTPVSPATPAKG